ncbi:MAG: hypothetical protein IR160_03175 [Salinibacterium sp.]|nr:hypothetical protein [Salinibacterium sp.]MBF0671569.1 hypothetical protein [Salinibacterium sp.]
MNSRLSSQRALEHLEERMVSTFGTSYEEYDAGIAKHVVPRAYLSAAVGIADASGIVDKLHTWDGERRKSNAGKKALIPLRALVVLYLLNAQMGVGVTYRELARTLAYRFSPEHFAALGIRTTTGDVALWYKRIAETTYRLVALVDPTPTPLRKIMDAEAFARLLQYMETPQAQQLRERNQARLDDFCNDLVHASYRMLPTDLQARYRGNVAIDATKAHIRGDRNSANIHGARRNPDPLAGRYRREGSHEGIGAKTDEAAYELETAVMIWNKPGESEIFPSLVTEIGCHNPGKHVGQAASMAARHKRLGFDRFLLAVDRAYNGERIDTFHLPLAQLGVDPVFDYRSSDLGIQGHFKDLILVDGNWYVNWMPKALIDASRDSAAIDDEIEEAQSVLRRAKEPGKGLKPSDDDVNTAKRSLAELKQLARAPQQRLDYREPYRMIPKGRRDRDGFQRFSYPPIDKMMVKPAETPSVTTITIPPLLSEDPAVDHRGESKRQPRSQRSTNTRGKTQPIKHTQHLPYKSKEWRATYGMRSLVESSNNLLKTTMHGDIENARVRSGRGYAATYIALAFAVVASNLRRIASFFYAEAHSIQRAEKKVRARRRTDELGRPLPRPTFAGQPLP